MIQISQRIRTVFSETLPYVNYIIQNIMIIKASRKPQPDGADSQTDLTYILYPEGTFLQFCLEVRTLFTLNVRTSSILTITLVNHVCPNTNSKYGNVEN